MRTVATLHITEPYTQSMGLGTSPALCGKLGRPDATKDTPNLQVQKFRILGNTFPLLDSMGTSSREGTTTETPFLGDGPDTLYTNCSSYLLFQNMVTVNMKDRH